MLRDIKTPSGYGSKDLNPNISSAEKLRIISESPVVVQDVQYGIPGFDIFLPFGCWGEFEWNPDADDDPADHFLQVYDLRIADQALRRHGIGSRLIKSGARHGLVKDPSLDYICSEERTNLWFVNTLVKVFGIEKVTITKRRRLYGKLGDAAIEQVFDRFPPVEGEPYLLDGSSVDIDRTVAGDWELPVWGPVPNEHY